MLSQDGRLLDLRLACPQASCSLTSMHRVVVWALNLLNGVFLEPIGGKDDLQFNLERVVDSLARIVETRTRRVSV